MVNAVTTLTDINYIIQSFVILLGVQMIMTTEDKIKDSGSELTIQNPEPRYNEKDQDDYNEDKLNLCMNLQQKQTKIKSLRESIFQKKLEIKKLATNIKPENITNSSVLSRYFSKADDSNTHEQKVLRDKIKNTRLEIDTVKKQLAVALRRQASDIGSIKLTQEIQRLNNRKSQLAKLQIEKDLITKQLQGINKDIKDSELDELVGRYSKQKQEHGELMDIIKEQKLILQTAEKEDRYYSEKLQFLMGCNKRNLSIKIKPALNKQISNQIKELTQQMQLLIEEREEIDIKNKKNIQHLKSNAKKVQAQNWNIINKLRQYDAFLLKHYNQQNRRKNGSFLLNSITSQVPHSRPKQIQNTYPAVKAETVVKRKMLFQICQEQNGIRLSDYQLKPDKIVSIEMYYYNSIIIGINTKYETPFGIELGYKMSCFPTPKDVSKLVFEIKNGDQIQEFGLGFSLQDQIVQIRFVTRDGVIFNWGQKQPSKRQVKKIAAPLKIWMVGILGPSKSFKSPNNLILKGLAFQVVTIFEDNQE